MIQDTLRSLLSRSAAFRNSFNRSHDAAAADPGIGIPGADILDAALDGAVSGATPQQLSDGPEDIPHEQSSRGAPGRDTVRMGNFFNYL